MHHVVPPEHHSLRGFRVLLRAPFVLKAFYRRCRGSLGARPLSAAQGQAYGFGSPTLRAVPPKILLRKILGPCALHTSLLAARQGLWRLFAAHNPSLKGKEQ